MANMIVFNCFTEDLAEKKHDLQNDVIKLGLTAGVYDPDLQTYSPPLLTDAVFVPSGSSYDLTLVRTSSAQGGGVYKLILEDAVWTGPLASNFQYVVMYNATAGNKLIGYYNYDYATYLNDGETFTVNFSPETGAINIQSGACQTPTPTPSPTPSPMP